MCFINNNKYLDKEDRISKEIKRINKICKEIPKDKKTALEGLIKRSAFMRIMLEDLEEDLNINGYVEMFSQSENADPYERKRPASEIYNTTIKNYSNVCKQILDLLPKNVVLDEKTIKNKEEIKDFEKFIK